MQNTALIYTFIENNPRPPKKKKKKKKNETTKKKKTVAQFLGYSRYIFEVLGPLLIP